MNIEAAADLLRSARDHGRTLDPFTDDHPYLDESWGYAVQDLGRAADERAGDALIGAKLGLTSEAKQVRMGVRQPIIGHLTGSMLLGSDELARAVGRWVQPRIEPEIALITSRDLGRASAWDDAASAVASVCLAAEVIDSRWSAYRFGLVDVVADNTSAAGVVLGPPLALEDVPDLADLVCTVEVDGVVVHRATGAAVLGHPLRALQVLSDHLARRGRTLPAGSLVLAGALTDAVPLTPGRHYRLAVEHLGSLTTDLTTETP